MILSCKVRIYILCVAGSLLLLLCMHTSRFRIIFHTKYKSFNLQVSDHIFWPLSHHTIDEGMEIQVLQQGNKQNFNGLEVCEEQYLMMVYGKHDTAGLNWDDWLIPIWIKLTDHYCSKWLTLIYIDNLYITIHCIFLKQVLNLLVELAIDWIFCTLNLSLSKLALFSVQ